MNPTLVQNSTQNCTPAQARRAMQTVINMGMPVTGIGLQQTINSWGVADVVPVKMDELQPDLSQAIQLQIGGQWHGAAQIFRSIYVLHPFEPFLSRAYYGYLAIMEKLAGRTPTKDEFEKYLLDLPSVGPAVKKAIEDLEVK